MVLRKNFRKKRKYPVKRKVAKSTRAYVKKAIDKMVEDKYLYFTATVNVDNIQTPVLLNGMAQGTTIGTRVGAKIRVKSILIRLNYSQTGTGFGIYQRFRAMLVQDRQCNGLAPDLSQLLLNITGGVTYAAPLNPQGFKRYKVLMDHHSNLQVHGGTTDVPQASSHYKSRKLGFTTLYTNGGNTGNVSDINTNSLYLIMMGTNAAPNGIACNYQIRVFYEDA